MFWEKFFLWKEYFGENNFWPNYIVFIWWKTFLCEICFFYHNFFLYNLFLVKIFCCQFLWVEKGFYFVKKKVFGVNKNISGIFFLWIKFFFCKRVVHRCFFLLVKTVYWWKKFLVFFFGNFCHYNQLLSLLPLLSHG